MSIPKFKFEAAKSSDKKPRSLVSILTEIWSFKVFEYTEDLFRNMARHRQLWDHSLIICQ